MNLVVINPHAAGGRAARIWPKLEPILMEYFDDLIIAITRRVDEVAAHIDKARAVGVERILIVGGDGTNHSIINALLKAPPPPGAPPIAIGQIPVGTGRDWARTLGIPHKPKKAIRWLAEAQPQACDVGRVRTGTRTRLFLNIASTGVGADIDRRVNAVARRRPWTFIRAILATLRHYTPQHVRVTLDGAPFYAGTSYVVGVANGQWFGHGIWAAPQARYDDGQFDVVLMEGGARAWVVRRLMQAYKGAHIGEAGVHYGRAARVEVTPLPGQTLGLDLDGEPDVGDKLLFEVLPGAVQVLTQKAPLLPT